MDRDGSVGNSKISMLFVCSGQMAKSDVKTQENFLEDAKEVVQ